MVNRGRGVPTSRSNSRGRGSGRGQAAGSVNQAAGGANQVTDSVSGVENCGLCSLNVGEDCIGCDKCPLWFHPFTQCTGLNRSELNCVKSGGGRGIKFVCSACRCLTGQSLPPNITNSTVDESASISQLFAVVKALAESVAQLTQQVTLMINNPVQQTSSSESFTRERLYAEMREFEERKKRVDSIIVKGTGAGNIGEFTNSFNEVSEHLINDRPQTSEIFCVNNDRCIYRVKLQSREVKTALLNNAKNLKYSDQFKNIYIQRDLTYSQRQDFNKKRAEARTRTQQYGPLPSEDLNPTGNNVVTRRTTRLSVLEDLNPTNSQASVAGLPPQAMPADTATGSVSNFQ